MNCTRCKAELQFTRFYEGANGFMAEFYCASCVTRKVMPVKTEFMDGK